MIVLVDADSLVWSSCYKKRENPDDEPFYDKLEDAAFKFDEVFMSIVNHLEDIYPIDEIITFNDSKGNFRKHIDNKYKANRKKITLPPLLQELHNYVRENYNSKHKYGVETDDLVATYWKQISDELGKNEVIIVSIDKDYKQFPCLMYNYHFKHKCVYDITEQEALYNFYEQMIIGDTADNVNYCKGYGQKFAEKYLKDCETKYQYTRKIYELFKTIYKGKANLKYRQCYTMLKLKTDVL